MQGNYGQGESTFLTGAGLMYEGLCLHQKRKEREMKVTFLGPFQVYESTCG